MMINNELGIVFGAWHIPDWRLSSVKALVPEAEYIAYTVADDNGIVHATTTKTPPSGSWWSAKGLQVSPGGTGNAEHPL